MQSRQGVARAKAMSQDAMAIDVAREDADAAAAERPALVPISARRRIQLGAQPLLVEADVGPRVRPAEEAKEGLVVGEILQRADLESSERDMRAVEINGGDARRIGRQIREHVASARGDRDHLAVGADLERLHVDDRVFPDLRINKLREGEGEHALEHACRVRAASPDEPQP